MSSSEHGLRLKLAFGQALPDTQVVSVRTRQDRVVVAVIWLVVILVALVFGSGSSDPGGAGELAAGVGLALTGVYLYLRKARSLKDLVPTSDDDDAAPVGAATAAWLRNVVMLLLWVAGSVIFIVLGLRDGYALLLGGFFPLAAYLAYRRRRSAGHP